MLAASQNTQAAIAQNVTNATSALNEAKADVDSAKTAAEQAQTSVTNAEALVSQKQSAATELAAAKAAAEEALVAAKSENVAEDIASAEQAVAAATEAQTQADIAINAAKAAAEDAKAIANTATSTVAEAQNKLNVAASLKADADAKIQASQDAVKAALAAVDAAKAALATAEKAAQEASTQAEAAIQKPEQLGDDVFETLNVMSDGSAFDSAKLANGDYKLLSSASETLKVPTDVAGQYTLKHVTTATYRVINRQTVAVAVNKDLSGSVLTDLTGYVLDHKNDAATSHDVVADNGDVTTYVESVQYWRVATNNDVVVNVDESGSTITPSDAYKFVSTSTHVDTTPSGDTITTQTNVYHKIVNHTTTVDKHVDESGIVITPSNEYKLVGTEVSDAVVTETAANGDTTSVVTTTHTYHKIVNHTTTVDKHVDESGIVITPSNEYKLVGTEVSDAVVTETAANGDTTSVVTTTHTYHKIVTSTAPDKLVNVDASGHTLVNTAGMVQQSSTTKQESVTKDNGDIVITNVTTTVWKAVEHKPQQVGETQYEMNLINSGIAGDYANISRIDGSVNLDYYELVNEVPERTNVQANGDYTLVTKSYFKLTDNGYRHFMNIEMAKALDEMKRKLWTMFPDVVKTLAKNGVTEGITAMSEAEQLPGADAQAAAQHVIDAGVLEHTNYKGMRQIIASGSGVFGNSYTDSSYTLIMKNVKTACDLYWDELDALKEVVETGDSSADYGHLVMIMTVSKVYTAVASNSEHTRSWVATNGI